MNEQRYLELISDGPHSIGSRLLRFVLRVASCGYSAAMSARNLMFDWRLRPIHTTPVPVISVGNLTTGGTGKTPVVAQLIEWLAAAGARPGIVSRGYKQLSESGNDEARVLELLGPNVPHVQNRDRVAAVREVVSANECNVVVADDAFQHRRMARALDIVLIDAKQPWGHGHVLPRGLLREARSGLRRADAVIMTRADQADPETRVEIWNEVRRWKPEAAAIEIAFQPDSLVDLGGERHRLDVIDGPVFAYCGIGNPDAFRGTLEQHGLDVRGFRRFADHYHYTRSDLADVERRAADAGTKWLITTVKDLVKIDADWLQESRLLALDIRAHFLSGEDKLREQVIQAAESTT